MENGEASLGLRRQTLGHRDARQLDCCCRPRALILYAVENPCACTDRHCDDEHTRRERAVEHRPAWETESTVGSAAEARQRRDGDGEEAEDPIDDRERAIRALLVGEAREDPRPLRRVERRAGHGDRAERVSLAHQRSTDIEDHEARDGQECRSNERRDPRIRLSRIAPVTDKRRIDARRARQAGEDQQRRRCNEQGPEAHAERDTNGDQHDERQAAQHRISGPRVAGRRAILRAIDRCRARQEHARRRAAGDGGDERPVGAKRVGLGDKDCEDPHARVLDAVLEAREEVEVAPHREHREERCDHARQDRRGHERGRPSAATSHGERAADTDEPGDWQRKRHEHEHAGAAFAEHPRAACVTEQERDGHHEHRYAERDDERREHAHVLPRKRRQGAQRRWEVAALRNASLSTAGHFVRIRSFSAVISSDESAIGSNTMGNAPP
jgi:hypothetical protein